MTVIGMGNVIPIVVNASVLRDLLVMIVLLIVDVKVTGHVNLTTPASVKMDGNGIQCIGPGICGCSTNCHQGTCWNGQCECFEGYSGNDCSHYNPNIMANKDVSVGMNIGGLSYYSSELKFVDIGKLSQSWITQRTSGPNANKWDTNEQNLVNWRNDGYPSSLPDNMRLGKLMLRSTIGLYAPKGNYTLLYDGEGEISFRFAHEHIMYNGKGRMVININEGKDGIELILSKTHPGNPVRNVRFIMPGFEDRYEKFPFYPPFLETIKRYSELRYMDFLHTNGHTPEPTTWDERRKQEHHTHTGSEGAAIEHMIDLSNRIGANPWFNMPHAADDNFVTQFAKLVEKTLRNDLKIYIEYSNEVWNGIFRQTHYTQEQGVKLKLDPQSWKAGMKYYNKRSSEIMQIWKTVFGSQPDKIVPVWAWQTGYQDYTRQAIEDLGNRTRNFKAIAITGYFDCNNLAGKHAAEMLNMSNIQMETYCNNQMSQSESSFQYFMDLAKKHGLKLLMYEGGPSIMEGSAIGHGISHDDVTNKAIAFNRDQHIKSVVDNLLEAWYKIVVHDPQNSSPGGLFNYFSSTGTPSKYGSWGMLEYTGQDPGTVPKYEATQSFITRHYSHNRVDIPCSFLQQSTLGYGCFLQKRGALHWRCAVTDDDGVTWSYYPDVGNTGDTLVLDGFNPTTHTVYVRSVNKIGVNNYHSIDTRTANTWKTHTSFDYYSSVASRNVRRRLPNGVYNYLDTQGRCS
ncbi:unnamed protein product [Mytilus edulis]|uniref:EGF-like domain-containing protein n=1 Tax=Mytilus edulis TaxID=6550 RepID=A0A8S3SJH2_MYTED|nr:unnamed protein product [Mytilus edulis]